MPARLHAKHWRARADEARGLADLMADGDWRWRLLRIASDYTKLAELAQAEEGSRQGASLPGGSVNEMSDG